MIPRHIRTGIIVCIDFISIFKGYFEFIRTNYRYDPMKLTVSICKTVLCLSLAVLFPVAGEGMAAAQTASMTLGQVIEQARTSSVSALEAKASFVSSYWAWRSYKASRLPSLNLYGNLASFDRSLRQLQNYETGELVYTSNYNMQNSIGLSISQNITFTGGTLSLYSDLSRIDQFGVDAGKTYYAQPVTLYYEQPLLAYNRFKWEKKLSPREYEVARRTYIESMENVTINAGSDTMAIKNSKVANTGSLYLENVTFDGAKFGVYIDGLESATIINCTFKNIGKAAIGIGSDAKNVTLSGNSFELDEDVYAVECVKSVKDTVTGLDELDADLIRWID